MRLLKLFLTALFVAVALTAGVLVAAVVAVAGAAVFLLERLLRRPSPTRLSQPVRGGTSGARTSDVIDVTATEVPLDPSSR